MNFFKKKEAYFKAIQDIIEFVSSLEQIGRNLTLNYLDLLQWMDAVRMSV